MLFITRSVMTVICVLCVSVGAYAQQTENKSSHTLPEVVIIGKQEKTSTVVPDAEQVKKAISKTAGGVDLITADDYKTGRSTTPQDLLGYSPGIFV